MYKCFLIQKLNEAYENETLLTLERYRELDPVKLDRIQGNLIIKAVLKINIPK